MLTRSSFFHSRYVSGILDDKIFDGLDRLLLDIADLGIDGIERRAPVNAATLDLGHDICRDKLIAHRLCVAFLIDGAKNLRQRTRLNLERLAAKQVVGNQLGTLGRKRRLAAQTLSQGIDIILVIGIYRLGHGAPFICTHIRLYGTTRALIHAKHLREHSSVTRFCMKKDRAREVADPVFPSQMDGRFNPSDRLGLGDLGVGRSLSGSGATVLGLAHIGPLGLLIRHGASLLAEELLEAVDGNDEAQDHQQDGKDELQALGGGDGDGGRGGGSRDGTEETVGLDGGHAAHGALDQRGEGAAEQEDDGHVEHPALAAGALAEHGEGDHGHAAEQLVGSTKERPDVGIATKSESETGKQGNDRGEPGVAEDLHVAGLGLDGQGIVGLGKELGERSAGDAGDGVERGQGQSGDVHGHKDGSERAVNTEGLHTAGDAGGEDLERGGSDTGVEGAGTGGVHVGEHDASDDDGKDADEGLDNHGAVTDLDGVLLLLDLLRRGAGRNEAVETGESTASDGDEQDREHHAGGSGEAGEDRSGDSGLTVDAQDDDAEDSADDHDNHHDGSEVVTRGLEHLDGHSTSKDQVDHDDGEPLELIQVERELHTDGEHENHEDHAGDELGSAGEVELLLGPTKGDSDEGEQDGDGTSAAGGIGLGEVDGTGSSTRSVNGRGEHERLADHVGESGDDDDAEQPAEQQEQATAGLADVLFDELSERLAVVLHRSVQGTKVVDGTKEDAADEDPEHDGQPAKGHGDDRTRNRASTADRAELVRERGEGGDGREALAVLHALGRREGLFVNAPLVGQPSAIAQIAAGEHRRGHNHEQNSVHYISSSKKNFLDIKNEGRRLRSTALIFISRPLSYGLAVCANPHQIITTLIMFS